MYPKQWKGLTYDYPTIAQMDNITPELICLTQREVALLIACLVPAKWRTRWVELPENQDLDWVEELQAKLMDNMCCDPVWQCLEDDIRRLQDLMNGTGTDGGGGTDRLGTGNPSLGDCSNKDAIFGATSYLVEYLISQARDAFEIIEAATNFVEAVATWLHDVFPVPNIVQQALDYVTWIQNAIAENFEAQVTVSLIDQYRCDLFCLWTSNDCQGLTTQRCFDYFMDRLGSPGFGGTAWQLMIFLVSGTWTGTQIVDAMLAGMIGVMILEDGVPFINIPSVYSFQTIINLGSNDLDPDWSILCTECPVFECWDMGDLTDITIILGYQDPLQGNPEPSIHSASGVNSAVYPLNATGTSNGIASAIRIELPAPSSIDQITFQYMMTATGTEALIRGYEVREAVSDTLLARVTQNVNHNDSEWHTWTINGIDKDNVGAIVVWVSKTSEVTTTGEALLDNVCVSS